MPNPPPPSKSDQFLDALLDALLERQAARRALERASPPPERPVVSDSTVDEPRRSSQHDSQAPDQPPTTPEPLPPSAPVPRGDVSRLLGRLMLLVGLLALVANLPVNAAGLSLARMVPSHTALVIRDGLIVKGSGPEFYVLQNNKLRWISSLDAFQHYGYRWEQVHAVDDAFLADFEQGPPLHVLLKCEFSPHIYRLENERKRWIKDIATFVAEGHVWRDVRFVNCDYLRRLPNCLPIPEDAGPPPQP